MIRHHPSSTVLLSYAAGSLPAPHARTVMLHLAACADCADELRLMVAAAGALLDGLPPAPMSDGALARTVARLREAPADAAADTAPIAWPSALETLATRRWHWRGPGVTMMPLMARDASGTRLDLIKVAPGTALLDHGHTDLETTLVLQGSFEDGSETYATGDFAEADGTLDHRPRALAGPDCICLVATSGHLSPRGLVGRLIRPLIGM